MRPLAPILLAGMVVSAAPAALPAQVIDHTKVRQYVDDEVTVEGPVARVDRGRGGTVRFAIGRSYSRRTLEVVVPAELVSMLATDIRFYEGKTIQVQGRIRTGEAEGIVRGRGEGTSSIPAIVLEAANRLKVITETPAPETPPPAQGSMSKAQVSSLKEYLKLDT